ncbi:helix-turn-helix domain-containing protein [Methanotrichaceae archaeon M04Ac]|uniref:Helix-turn-helix domain-containing protein n=1 Tax=Candidatus Methanocrinis alkalitolerans TaxID=3033395 RepID=A0ABT5XHA6_9EURY|nr:helix-turn-helix domain-containing protein [Candidatus Methanocrinis alkalitolerans]MCR3884541.1 helix-turn-helix domain-containing protein [Methanothrix sp.]MDF0594105.1 helix-turn-helix domain-containing protein [Candidatus Methanocrinis alkalitolerans]
MPKPEQVSIRRCMAAEELDDRIKELEKWARVLKRLRFIRYRYQGFSVETSAHLVGITKSVGYTWQKRWNDGGYEGLIPRHGGGRPTKLSEAERGRLELLLRQRDRWTTMEVRDLVKGQFGVEYTPKQIRIILKKLGIIQARSSSLFPPESGECSPNMTSDP